MGGLESHDLSKYKLITRYVSLFEITGIVPNAHKINDGRPASVTIKDATFHPKPITGTAPHHQIAKDYRLTSDYGSSPANYRHLHDFIIKDIYRYRQFTDKFDLFTAGYRR